MDGTGKTRYTPPSFLVQTLPLSLSRTPYTEEIITASKMEARTSQNYTGSKHLVIPVRNTLV